METNHIIFLAYKQVSEALCKKIDVGWEIVHLCTVENSWEEIVSELSPHLPTLSHSSNGSAQDLTLLCIVISKY